MFWGRYERSVDPKGRLALPSKLLESIPLQADRSVFCLSRGHDQCLNMYTEREWNAVVKSLLEAAATAPAESVLIRNRLLSSSVNTVSVDAQARILLQPEIRKYAEIATDVVIIGNINVIEIWDKAKWDAFEAKHSKTFDQIDNEIAKYMAARVSSNPGPNNATP